MTQDYNTPRCYSYIRFSTLEQLKGYSLARQMEKSRLYAQEKGLVLDESLTLKDLGLSAFSGKHRTRGALGEFLELAKRGKIPKNSILLVESLDRLSRQKIMTAFDQLREITSYGIIVVTLIDRSEYRHETWNDNISQVFTSLGIMARSYDESLTKSIRHIDNWKAKRENIAEKKLTARAPAWLKLDESKIKFNGIEYRVAIVRRIFNMALQGIGAASIAKKLNTEKIPAWKGDNGWFPSYVKKILHNKAVLGEFEPHIMVTDEEAGEKVRKPTGEVFSDYYPRIIADEVFYRVQERCKSNKDFGGKNGKLSNLFGGLAKCGYCGKPMQFVNKGNQTKAGMYLVCDNARRKMGCEYHSFRYPEFEDAFLSFCSGLNIADLLTDDAIQKESKIAGLQGRLAVINDEFKQLERRINVLYETLSQAENQAVRDRTMAEINKLVTRQTAIPAERSIINQEINQLSHKQTTIEQSIQGLKELYQFIGSVPAEQAIDVRMKLRGEIRQLVERIDVYPVGYMPSNSTINTAYEMEVDFAAQKAGGLSIEAADQSATRLTDYFNNLKDRNNRFFIIRFKNGNYRMITPSPNEAAKYKLWVDKQGDENFFAFVGKSDIGDFQP
ncbi:resolvase-like serine recombinase [Geotalea daltonii FRC-32]|uniref:Resolvase-like serine recombinase n=1 Tax=Geotalea daltonii (strain DSM 22248 / JCM 15807 / FRC-32) TaxID=316067 RepID=B9M114_GEODF|nr:recombinase family protein [Geotalea daltonii]ACM19084.1 resolvase-like serine recombinase [Geotalea daltonii FRC-32]